MYPAMIQDLMEREYHYLVHSMPYEKQTTLFPNWANFVGGDRVPFPAQHILHSIEVAMVIAGIACLVLGATWLVDGAVKVAKLLGVSDNIAKTASDMGVPNLVKGISLSENFLHCRRDLPCSLGFLTMVCKTSFCHNFCRIPHPWT